MLGAIAAGEQNQKHRQTDTDSPETTNYNPKSIRILG